MKKRIELTPIPFEEWKPVFGYEGLYEISSLGRVKSLPKYNVPNARLLKPVLNAYGYPFVGLSKNKKVRGFLVHRLVAIAFLDNDRKCTDVNHLDGKRANYKLENLEWCTRGENHKHAFRTGLRHQNGDKNQSRKLNSIQVEQIIAKYIPNVITREMLAKEYNVNISTIRDLLDGTSWSTITKIKKGRGKKTVITNTQVSEIRELYKKNNISQYRIAEKYGVTQSYISNILKGKRRVKEDIYEQFEKNSVSL